MALYTPQETAAPAQAIQRGMAQLSASMDRMSAFFGEKARMEAEIEGAEYGAKNAPTEQQLRDAFQSGEELSLPGGTGTIFDRAARQAALDITQTEVEFQARKRINEILTNAELNGTNPATILDDIDAVTHGFAATFDETSPGVSRKLRAGLSIWANGKMAAYENSYIAEQKTRSQSNWISNQLGMFEGLATIIEKGLETTDANGEKTYRLLTSDDMAALKLGGMQEMERKGFAPSSLTAYGNMFDKEIVEAANRVLIDSVLIGEDPQEAITAIGQGKVTDLDIATQNAVATLRGQNVAFSDIAKELRTRRIDQLKYVEAEEDQINRENEKLEEIYVADAMEALVYGNVAEAEVAIGLVKRVDPVRGMELEKEWLEAGESRTVSDPDSIRFLERLQSNISFPDVATHFNMLNLADKRKYYQRAETYQSEAVQTGLTIMKGALSLPANIDAINDADPDFEKVQIFRRLAGQLASEAASAKSNNIDIDPDAIAQRLLSGISEDLDVAVKRLVVDQANLIVDQLVGIGNFVVERGDFATAVSIMSKLIIAKRNNDTSALNDIKTSLSGLIKQKATLIEAMK
jgi:hypothetical protein